MRLLIFMSWFMNNAADKLELFCAFTVEPDGVL